MTKIMNATSLIKSLDINKRKFTAIHNNYKSFKVKKQIGICVAALIFISLFFFITLSYAQQNSLKSLAFNAPETPQTPKNRMDLLGVTPENVPQEVPKPESGPQRPKPFQPDDIIGVWQNALAQVSIRKQSDTYVGTCTRAFDPKNVYKWFGWSQGQLAFKIKFSYDGQMGAKNYTGEGWQGDYSVPQPRKWDTFYCTLAWNPGEGDHIYFSNDWALVKYHFKRMGR
jgi:hypothetical protein